MSLTEKFISIVFSRTLAQESTEKQRHALDRLGQIFERSSRFEGLRELFVPPRLKPYYGTEVSWAMSIHPDDRQQVEALGFEVKEYDHPLGSNGRNYVTIRISPQLATTTAEEKKSAIIRLQDYLESHPEIWTGYDSTVSVAEATAEFLEGRVNLDIAYESEIISGDLNEQERKDVEALGFSTRSGGGLVFAM